MKARPRVHVVKRANRKFLMLRYRHPRTLKEIYRSTGTNVVREAERMAAKWERELAEEGTVDPERTTWADLRLRFESEHLAGLSKNSILNSIQSLGLFEKMMKPGVLADITASVVSGWVVKLRKTPYLQATETRPAKYRSETTIDRHLSNLHTILSWAERNDMLVRVPKFPRIERSKRRTSGGSSFAKGRPLTDAEIERMVQAIQPPSREVEFFVRGLAASGLRISEALRLSWDSWEPFRVVLREKDAIFIIPAEGEKGFSDRVYPVSPEFTEMLRAVVDKTGRVFKLPKQKQRGGLDWTVSRASEMIGDLGEAANIIVNPKGKFASAHDLRRTFAEKWTAHLKPQYLQIVMRHRSIQTTMGYYASRDASEITAAMHAAQGNTQGNTNSEANVGQDAKQD